MFPSYEVHAVDAVSSGRRVSLVAWILSKEADPQSSPFWDDAQSTHEHVLVDAGRARMAGRNFPRELELHTLMILGNVVMRQGNWSRLLELSAAQVNLSQQIHGRSGVLDDTVSVLFPARPATYHVRVTNLKNGSLLYDAWCCLPGRDPRDGALAVQRGCKTLGAGRLVARAHRRAGTSRV